MSQPKTTHQAMDEPTLLFPDTDLDLSFTSTATDRTTTTTSARTSLARTSSLTLSFNDRLSTVSTAAESSSASLNRRPHRSSDPLWSAIQAATTLSSDGRLHLRHLKLLRHLGSGNLGRVFLCRLRDCDAAAATFALKVVDKDLLSPKKLSHAETEAEILHALDHPFLPTLYARIDVSHYTCLLIDYCPGGDLHSLLRKQPHHRLPLAAARFFAAEVLLALEYLHALGIVYRDLKPENVLLREDGHVMLSDFDLCFKSDPVTAFSRSCVGTHEYLAPELVSGNGHGNGVDWWALGVFIHELLYGTTPFKGCSKEGTLRNIASSEGVRFRHVAEREEAGMGEARDLIEKLLVKDPRRRLGSLKGATDVKRHAFFYGIKWPLIRTYRPPEVKGLVLKRNKSHVTTVKKRRCWWKRLGHAVRSNGISTYNLFSHYSNNYYYHYVQDSHKVR
uniref:non-specific serine/threonine protein kinase n=1 Tax=Cajanus cajan TaxID=3821 RepID=A0A151TDG9_CAJCA|nr:Phototropin-2 [Cajanus cajan]